MKLHGRQNLVAGGTMVALGLATAITSVGYNIGTLQRMGPGYFPLMLGVLLALLGLAIALTGRSPDAAAKEPAPSPPQWRGWACITAGILAFMFFGKWGGLAPATFALVFISALGDRQHTLKTAALLALFMTATGSLIFHWGLSLQFPLLRWG